MAGIATVSPVRRGDSADAAGGSIAVEGIVKRFGNVAAVDGVSLAAEEGEFVALLGPSGSGKTTVLMCMAGFELPSEGRVLLGGRDVTHLPPQRRNLGMVFQRYTLFPHMSVLENIAFPLKMRGMARGERERLAREALETVRLAGYGGRMPSQLSGGQQQRVALARAIVYRPRVLLMDEPLSALDKALREEMQIEIKHLQRELGITVVFVTHDQTEALTMADRIAVLEGGRLQQCGDPQDLYEAPRSPFVAGFIGETNFVHARATAAARDGGAVAVVLESGRAAAAAAVGAIGAGDEVVIAIRPERLRLAPPSANGASPPLAARLVETIYAGVATTCVLATDGGQMLRARVPAGQGGLPAELGASVWVDWDAASARAFRREGNGHGG